MTGAAAAATAYWFGRGLQPAMPGVQSVQPDAGSLFRRTIHNATRLPVKRHRGSRDTHTGHTSAHADTQITETNLTSNQTLQRHTRTTRRDSRNPKPANRGRLNSRKNSRRPGVDRSLRPTQKRPPPANPTTCLHPQPVCVCVQNTVPCAVVHGASGTPTGTYR